MVLLDLEFYRTEMLPLLLRWTALWLHGNIESDRRYRRKITSVAHSSSSSSSTPATRHPPASTTPHSLSATEGGGDAESAFDAFMETVSKFLITSASKNLTAFKESLESRYAPKEMQLLFLARDWLTTILPHVLSKIDRVGFGMLQGSGGAAAQPGAGPSSLPPLSRRLMAIPFVAKDVPSRSSEFAHPDVVLGLTVLAYRYEGLRLSDTRELLRQLKNDYSRQVGASEQRPASRLYASWLHAAALSAPPSSSLSRIPLSQLQVQDPAHLHALHNTFKRIPVVLYYYLSHHVFPRTMNFQQLKISACGHELGSSLLFQKRIGFSGTPSNLLPLDLGECCYEPGSDGHMLSVLTNPAVTSCELLPDDWSPLSLLRRIATANPPFHSLIDTGALITNMDNEQVARYLLEYLPSAQFEGVVFLDGSDRQVVLLRSSEMIVPIAQCGIPLSRRFTFFDQVHTTGMDIKQMPTATAVVTLGKDLVFRDYAQGSYRMRGIGKGQKLRVYVIPEVQVRLKDVLGPSRLTGRLEVDVPAWLILNAMRLEGLQFVKLCQQELLNVWRKRALQVLVCPPPSSSSTDPSPASSTKRAAAYRTWVKSTSDFVRCRRFTALGASALEDSQMATDYVRLMRGAIKEFREVIAFPVPVTITAPIAFQQKVEEHLKSKMEALLDVPVHEPEVSPPALGLALGGADAAHTARQDATRRVTLVLSRMTNSSGGGDADRDDDDPEAAVGLSAEVVHEQEAEEEQEQEAEQEEQRVSHFSRDDEQHIPWAMLPVLSNAATVDVAATRLGPATNSPFFQCNGLQLRPDQPMLDVDPGYFVSDNFFRATWRGSGERRLKNCMLFAHWLVVGSDTDPHVRRFVSGLLTLAEGESLRWYIHHSNDLNASVAVALCMVNQSVAAVGSAPAVSFLDASDLMHTVVVAGGAPADSTSSSMSTTLAPTAHSSGASAVVFFRYLNNDMFYSRVELTVLRELLIRTPADVRLGVFLDMLRGRRRPNNEWQDTPIAEVFVENDAQHAALMARSLMRRFEEFVRKLPQGKRNGIASTWRDSVARSNDLVAAGPADGQGTVNHSLTGVVAVDGAIVALHAALSTVDQHASGSTGRPSSANAVTSTGLEEFAAAIRFALAANSARSGLAVSAGTLAASMYENEEGTSATLDTAAPTHVPVAEWVASVAPPLFLPPHATHQLLRCPTCRVRSVVPRRASDDVTAEASCPHCATSSDNTLSAALLAEQAAVGYDEHWQCSVCTLINAPHCPVCVVCGTASPLPPKPSARHVDVAALLGPWACGVCTLVNEPSLPICGACGTANPNAAAATSAVPSDGDVGGRWDCPAGHWTCSVEQGGCSKYNPNSAFYCQVCDRARPNLASLRF
jgi:hypothetical protein